MSTLRWDPIHEDWVITAVRRADRPSDFVGAPAGRRLRCPFCPGHEDDTPKAILTLPARSSGLGEATWSVRCIPNLYPAVEIGEYGPETARGFTEERPACGGHEVVVESPWHDRRFDSLPASHAASVIRVIRERMGVLRAAERTGFVMAFKNHGRAAGASLRHGHIQVLSLPYIPGTMARELVTFRRHREASGDCLLCRLIETERQSECRVVLEQDGMIVLAPFASRFSFELLIAPVAHEPVFEEASDARLTGLSGILQDVLGRLRYRAGDPPFNYLIHSAPPEWGCRSVGADLTGVRTAFHWYVEILPRIGRLAGFEWGTGGAINSLPGEQAAARLRGEGA